MQNLYDLLGVRPDDDAETLKKAFRKAAKASHPDHHSDDPQAAARFRQISEAYEILRDAEQRAAYDRLLEFERRPLRHKVKRSRPDVKRHVVQDLMVGVLLAGVLAAGYQLFVRALETPGDTAAVVTESRQAAADQPAELITAERDRPERVAAPQMPVAMPTAPVAASAANDHDRPERANGEPVSNPAGQTITLAGRDSGKDIPAGAGVAAKTEDQPPIGHDAPSPDAQFSAADEHNDVPVADDRRDGKTGEPARANAGDVKPAEIRMSARAPAAAKRHAPSRPQSEQATLENRNAPAPDGAPSSIFGVGF